MRRQPPWNYVSRNMGALIAPPTNNISGEYIDGVFVTDANALFRTNPHLSQAHNHRQLSQPNHYRNSRNSTGNHLVPHNNSVFPYLWFPYGYHDDAYVTTIQILDRNFGSRLSGQPIDYRALLDVSHQEDDINIMMKTRTHCTKVEVDSEICVICLCEYVNDEKIGTLECGHEYHATCVEQWLLRGKKNCPICRSSALPSQGDPES
ncbi:hypothetical protein HAX54_004559 [Datura stramonium]|uniref:RING-type E3 ubiquitin transferase n=1 Tax=Datura stramonium TaxID=4076 RepID=A0ABS8T750_DATST|nr:hypothetical protein [Datura stramonium]